MNSENVERMLEEIVVRLTRVESRLVQLMLHLSLDPHKKVYDEPNRE
jgi:hypothetical protein